MGGRAVWAEAGRSDEQSGAVMTCDVRQPPCGAGSVIGASLNGVRTYVRVIAGNHACFSRPAGQEYTAFRRQSLRQEESTGQESRANSHPVRRSTSQRAYHR